MVLPLFAASVREAKKLCAKKKRVPKGLYIAFCVPGQEDFIPIISGGYLLRNKKCRSKMGRNLHHGQNCPPSSFLHLLLLKTFLGHDMKG
jgi:hypothetical protein